MSPDTPEKLARYAEKTGIRFPLLSDADLATIRRWGIVNPANPKLPHPTAVVVDADGVVRFLRQDVDYRHRPPASELLAALDTLGGAAAASRPGG